MGGSSSTHYFWDKVEIAYDLTLDARLYQQTIVITTGGNL
jgi:hypothetical protein